jgi:uridine phosphorylase
MKIIPASELIITPRGSIYHIDCRPEEVATTIILVGDPDRVDEISKHFDKIEYKNKHREFITHTGYIGNKRLSVCSTGIGPDNIDIVMNEMDALFNIDFSSRTIKENITQLQFIRFGTSGSLQEDIPVDHFVAGTHGLGLDNLLHFYSHNTDEAERQILGAFINHTGLQGHLSQPYISPAGVSLLKQFVSEEYHHGITVTCPGFYGPQGRILRMGLSQPLLVDRLSSFRFGAHRISNFEMETSAIYGIGKILGHQCLSLNAIIANRISKTFSSDTKAVIDKLIKKSLNIIADSTI